MASHAANAAFPETEWSDRATMRAFKEAYDMGAARVMAYFETKREVFEDCPSATTLDLLYAEAESMFADPERLDADS